MRFQLSQSSPNLLNIIGCGRSDKYNAISLNFEFSLNGHENANENDFGRVKKKTGVNLIYEKRRHTYNRSLRNLGLQ